MARKILVAEALDERDLLAKKITDKIGKISFVDMIRPNEENVFNLRQEKGKYIACILRLNSAFFSEIQST